MQSRIIVIGAGLSGLVTAKTLLDYGHVVKVFEKENELGGVWAGCRHYPGMTIQNTKDTYSFSDFPMPKDYPEFPSGQQMLDYLKSYANKFGLMPLIFFNRPVVNVSYKQSGGRPAWSVETIKNGQSKIETADKVIICNGTFSEPFVPFAEGAGTFINAGGKIIHTTGIGDAGQFRNKRIAVVGFGKSACDVAASLSSIAKETYIIFRQAKWKVPKRIKGINYKYIVLSRFGEALTKFNYRRRSERLIHSFGIPKIALGKMQRIFTHQQQLDKAKLIPGVPIDEMLVGELSVESDGFYNAVIEGKIVPVQSQIERYTSKGVILENNQMIEADVVIYGTGFHQQSCFLEPGIDSKVKDREGNFFLYRNILPFDVPGLFFNGYNASFFGTLTSEMAALWISEYLEGNIKVPPDEVAKKITSDFIDNRKQSRSNALSKGASVWPFNLTYIDWLLADMKAKLPFHYRLAEWLTLVKPSHYNQPVRRLKMRRVKKMKIN